MCRATSSWWWLLVTTAMGISCVGGVIRNADGHRVGAGAGRDGDGSELRSAVALAGVLLDDAGHGVALDPEEQS